MKPFPHRQYVHPMPGEFERVRDVGGHVLALFYKVHDSTFAINRLLRGVIEWSN